MTVHYGNRGVVKALAVLLAAAVLLLSVATTYADGETIEVRSSSITSEFPEGVRIKVEAAGANEIVSVAARLRIGQRTNEAYGYLCQVIGPTEPGEWRCEELEPGRVVNSELFWYTNTAARYIPPGTIVAYSFEIEDSEGTRLETERQEFIYHDVRYTWQEVSRGSVTVAYHGPVKTRAELILDTIMETLGKMEPLLGAEPGVPIRVTMYNNVKEMLDALVPGSATIKRELITMGQAWSEEGVLLVMGGSEAKGTASHEVTHIVVHRAAQSIFRPIPLWLNEGLAEYGNVEPGFGYDIALDFAVATGRLLPIIHMDTMPGKPEDAIIFYGQSRSIVRLMVERFEPDKMRKLMAALKSGKSIDNAIPEVYDLSLVELDNLWRESIGAAPYVPPESDRAVPTPVPQREIRLYSLTPQPDTETIGDMSDAATPTPTVEATTAHVPSPPPQLAAAKPTPTQAPEPEEPTATSPGCSAPLHGSTGGVDVAAAGLLLGLVGLGLGRRIRR